MVRATCRAWIITVVILFLWSPEGFALFENDGLSARYLSLGGGCVALSDEPSIVASNPAGLGFYSMKGIQLSWSQLFNLRELSAGDLYLACPLGKILGVNSPALGLGFNQFGESDLYQESVISFALGQKIRDYFSVGMAFKYMRIHFPSPYSNFSGVGFDSGLLIKIKNKVQIGGVIKNLNKPQLIEGSDDVPRIWDLGLALFPFENVILTIDLAKESGFNHQIKLGQEIIILNKLALRFGMVTEPVSYKVGTGFKWGKMKMDYAYLNHPTLGGSHKISLSFNW
jgi:hypothetical protein